MLRVLLGLLPVILVIGAGVGWFVTAPESLTSADLPDHTPDPVAGERVFNAGGCASCHAAPDAKDEARLVLSGGLELKTDFGSFFVPNISPEQNVGIGRWSMAQFATAMIKGTSPDGRHYFPSFPYGSYTRMRMEDVMDLKAYLDTLPASFNVAPPHQLSFPYNIRRGVGVWKWRYLNAAPVRPPATDEMAARGQYLVEGPGHCGECHTSRDFLGGLILDKWLGGAPNPEGKGRIPNITPHETGLTWSADDIAYYLETGFTPDFDSAGGAMASVVRNTSQLPPEDRQAIAAYLKSVPPVASDTAAAN